MVERKALEVPFVVSVTGHRHWKNRLVEKRRLFEALDSFIYALDLHDVPKEKLRFIHGCALGIDLWFGHYAIDRELPLDLFLPFPFEIQIYRGKFNKMQEHMLDYQMRRAENVYVVNRAFSTRGYVRRNEVLVNNCNLLASYYTRERSGSGHAVRYAHKTKTWVVDLRDFIGVDNNDPKSLINILLR